MKRIYTIFILTVLLRTIPAQDVHFTMFHAVPVLMNPASAGFYEGDIRASLNYKSQWGSVSKAFTTFACSVDSPIKNKKGKSILGVGLNAYKDEAGVSNFGITKLNLTISSIIHANNENVFSLGLNSGYGQASMDPGNLEWDSQFNGQTYNASAPSNESFTFQTKRFFDFSAGIMWAYQKTASTLSSNDRFNAQAGAAFYHLSRPEFLTYSGSPERMYSRIAVHANFHFANNYMDRIAIEPRFQAFIQGPSTEVNVGLMVALLLQEGSKYTAFNKGYAVNFGVYYRVLDSFSPSVELEIGGITIGFAYDTNLSGLTRVTYGRGGSEVYLKIQNPNKFLNFSRKPSFI